MKFQLVITTKDFGQIKTTVVEGSEFDYDNMVDVAKTAARGDGNFLELTIDGSYKIITKAVLLTSIIEIVRQPD